MTIRTRRRLRRLLVNLAKRSSTASKQETEVGVKWKVQRVCLGAIFWPWMFVSGLIVDDCEDDLWTCASTSLMEAEKLPMPTMFHAAADNGVVENIERGKERRVVVPLCL